MGFEIGNVSDVFVRLLDGHGLRKLNRLIDVSWRGHGSTLWIKIREQKIGGLELEFCRFIWAGNYL